MRMKRLSCPLSDIDDLPEDFLIDVVRLEETLLLTYGRVQGVGEAEEGIRG